MQENYAKISKIKQIEAIGAKRATMGHLVGPTDPTKLPAGVALQVPPRQSMGNGQETYPQAFSTVDSKSVHDQGPKRGITWIANSPCGMSELQWANRVHTHILLHPGATTPK